MSWLKISAGKSGAREVAVALLLFWVFLVCWSQFIADGVTFFERNFETITTAIFTLVFGAFGVVAVFNQLRGANETGPARMPEGFGRGRAARPARQTEVIE